MLFKLHILQLNFNLSDFFKWFLIRDSLTSTSEWLRLKLVAITFLSLLNILIGSEIFEGHESFTDRERSRECYLISSFSKK